MPYLGVYFIMLNQACDFIYSMLLLFLGLVSKIPEIRSLTSFDSQDGRVNAPEVIFLKSLEVSGSQNGRNPATIANSTTPQLQMSTFKGKYCLLPDIISGAA